MNTKNVIPREAKKIETILFSKELFDDHIKLEKMREGIDNYTVYIVKKVIAPEIIDKIKNYLKNIGSNSLPSYHFLKEGCPDFHRVHQFDNRSYVKSLMHQFIFHPWNQNIFDLFEEMKNIYYLKNLLGGYEKETFLHNTPKDGHVSRLSFHCYPKGGGTINKHADPVGTHQNNVPVLQMSTKGVDYKEGGLYAIGEGGNIIDLDSMLEKGDVLFFNAEIIHGVAPIDSDNTLDWLSFEGRWMMLASVIKSAGNETTANALELED